MTSREGKVLKIEPRTFIVKGDYQDLLVLQGVDGKLIFYFEQIGLETRCDQKKTKNFDRYVVYEEESKIFSFNDKPFDLIGYEKLGNNTLVLKTELLNYRLAFKVDIKTKRLLTVDIVLI